ncbi:uncharacterized protein LOC5566135 [Aedes aegypti]|uniref:Uncharacterized protein n=1 Tax=Aedes aegypti TaxID=7159 RepID=A0A6I8TAV8_AEDAE|nr:uncharacterized protein LOC5566135 [Aedes aegypti]
MSDNEMKPTMKRKPSGILKSDIPKNRKPSGLSIDVKTQKALDHEQISPPSSVSPQLSVTWATHVQASNNEGEEIDKESFVDDIFFSAEKALEMKPTERNASSIEIHDTEDEDYSASLNAIIKRKASIKKKRGSRRHRRTSSPISQIMGSSSGDRRRSSVYTTSSGEISPRSKSRFEVTIAQRANRRETKNVQNSDNSTLSTK